MDFSLDKHICHNEPSEALSFLEPTVDFGNTIYKDQGALFISLEAITIKGKLINKTLSKQNILIRRETINKMKRQTIDWKKIFVKYKLNRGPMSRMYKELLLNDKTKIIFEWTEDLNRQIIKEGI